LLPLLGIHVEVLLVLGDQRLAIVGVARLGDDATGRENRAMAGRALMKVFMIFSIARSSSDGRVVPGRRRQSGFLVTPT
jgi:hypothetical protein